ncbi:SID1 transmembrane family member 2 [Nasonia vitripennis]|uniref:SID1 transmembrane family member 1-like n=1 Tax=Nasonia vitripennis TaxID=7425 RepID=A0A7M7QXK0_NASVI|nr:SID1 transmembrane family member 2 [Nasonia vitripennis]XP_032454299.1 SID1 transmembrane family member 2 [Nasonia vitripennis]
MHCARHPELLKIAFAVFIVILTVGSSKTETTPLTPIIIPANYSYPYTYSLNKSIEYVFLYSENTANVESAARIVVQSEDAKPSYPLIVVVRQKKGILSWQIPLEVDNKYLENPVLYSNTSRTLCPAKYYKTINFDDSDDQYVTVSISTASSKNITFNLNLTPVNNFYMRSEQTRQFSITPSQPVYYGYDFKGLTDSSSVLITVKSEDPACMTFSIQNTSCPVFDLERSIQYAGYYQTVSNQGGITVPAKAYPKGFFIVLVVNADDFECSGNSSIHYIREKRVNITISNSITIQDYIVASFSALSMILTFCFAYIIGAICCKIHRTRKLQEQSIQDEFGRFQQNSIEPDAHTSGFQEIGEAVQISLDDDSSLDEDDIDLMEDAYCDKDVVRTKLVLSVCDLARKEPKILRKKSRLYIYYLITVAIFYTAPVVQLVVTYQNMLHVTGNQDLCYYNFLCSHPFYALSDFNHVFSNLGYVLLGLLFIFIVCMRERFSEHSHHIDRGFGIPQHYGLYYAMGFALMMEGVLSGSYHLCPNHSNFQFDTSFMYVIAVLCMVKIYQNRHPDINAQAPVTFGVLAVTILLALVGVLDGELYFWIFFTVIHLSTCLWLSSQIYYMGRWKFNGGVFRRMIMTMRHDARSGIIYLFRPLYWRRLLLLVMGNFCNLGLAVYGNMHHRQDFATYLLMILMSNLILYTFFYIVMKLCHGEKILLQPLLYIVLSFVAWGGALYFFINKTISWALTPAQSRAHNRPCTLLNFYDYHDIWHFLSALAMFFSFMVLLTLDDDLDDAHRSLISVF